jgi:plastocyanin
VSLLLLALVLLGACDGAPDRPDGATTDAGGLDAGGIDASARDAGGVRADAGPVDAAAAVDAPPFPFVAITPCDDPGDYVTATFVYAYDSEEYSPPCIRIARGTGITIEAEEDHPLAASPGGTEPSPIPTTKAEAFIRFEEPGFYPFHCAPHIAHGMRGVVQVTP